MLVFFLYIKIVFLTVTRPNNFYATQSHAIGGRTISTPSTTSTRLLIPANQAAFNEQTNRNLNDLNTATYCTDCERIIV